LGTIMRIYDLRKLRISTSALAAPDIAAATD